MAVSGVRRGNRRQETRLQEEDHDEGQRTGRKEVEEKDYRVVK